MFSPYTVPIGKLKAAIDFLISSDKVNVHTNPKAMHTLRCYMTAYELRLHRSRRYAKVNQ